MLNTKAPYISVRVDQVWIKLLTHCWDEEKRERNVINILLDHKLVDKKKKWKFQQRVNVKFSLKNVRSQFLRNHAVVFTQGLSAIFPTLMLHVNKSKASSWNAKYQDDIFNNITPYLFPFHFRKDNSPLYVTV